MIEIDARSLQRAQELLREIPGAAEKAIGSAIRKSVNGAKSDAAKEVANRYHITQRDVRKTVSTRVSRFGAELLSKGNVTPLSKYRTRQKDAEGQRSYTRRKKYLYANVVKGEGGTVAHAFIARMRSGHMGVFQRRSDGSLQELYGPSIPQAMTRKEVSSLIVSGIERRMDKNVSHEVNAFLMGYRR